jgi:hypothetical protein
MLLFDDAPLPAPGSGALPSVLRSSGATLGRLSDSSVGAGIVAAAFKYSPVLAMLFAVVWSGSFEPPEGEATEASLASALH